jgi:hypothetical protein
VNIQKIITRCVAALVLSKPTCNVANILLILSKRADYLGQAYIVGKVASVYFFFLNIVLNHIMLLLLVLEDDGVGVQERADPHHHH